MLQYSTILYMRKEVLRQECFHVDDVVVLPSTTFLPEISLNWERLQTQAHIYASMHLLREQGAAIQRASIRAWPRLMKKAMPPNLRAAFVQACHEINRRSKNTDSNARPRGRPRLFDCTSFFCDNLFGASRLKHDAEQQMPFNAPPCQAHLLSWPVLSAISFFASRRKEIEDDEDEQGAAARRKIS